jgi:hypothetical protein
MANTSPLKKTGTVPLSDSLYSAYFKTGRRKVSRSTVAEDQLGTARLLSALDKVQELIESSCLDEAVQKLLELEFTRILTSHIQATYTSDDVSQLISNAVRDLDPDEDDDDSDDSPDDTKMSFGMEQESSLS